jgi:hypothetical protein
LLPSPSSLRLLAQQKKEEKGDSVAVVAFFVGLRCNATKEEGDGSVAFLRYSTTKQQKEGDDNFATVPFFFAPSCATKKREEEGDDVVVVAFFALRSCVAKKRRR